MKMTPAERVAQRSWSILGRVKQFPARVGEETLTDLLVLDMLPHQHTRGFRLYPPTKRVEGWCGADLLVAVRHEPRSWSRFALQAKKLYRDDKYQMLDRVTDSLDQLERLEEFARQYRALPLYLLYNHSNTVSASRHWHCKKGFDEFQLGCTLVPSWHIRRMLDRPPPPRDFDSAHTVKQARPWRCAFDCPFAEDQLRQMASRSPDPDSPPVYDWDFGPMEDGWPEWLFQIPETQVTREDLDQFRGQLPVADATAQELFRSDDILYPERVLIVDLTVGRLKSDERCECEG